MNYILFDEKITRQNFLPFTFTRPVSEIRIGILTIREKWEKISGQKKVSVLTEDYLAKKYSLYVSAKEDNVWINSSLLPTPELLKSIKVLKKNECLKNGDLLIAINTGKEKFNGSAAKAKNTEWKGKPLLQLNHLWDIFSLNGEALEQDFKG